MIRCFCCQEGWSGNGKNAFLQPGPTRDITQRLEEKIRLMTLGIRTLPCDDGAGVFDILRIVRLCFILKAVGPKDPTDPDGQGEVYSEDSVSETDFMQLREAAVFSFQLPGVIPDDERGRASQTRLHRGGSRRPGGG